MPRKCAVVRNDGKRRQNAMHAGEWLWCAANRAMVHSTSVSGNVTTLAQSEMRSTTLQHSCQQCDRWHGRFLDAIPSNMIDHTNQRTETELSLTNEHLRMSGTHWYGSGQWWPRLKMHMLTFATLSIFWVWEAMPAIRLWEPPNLERFLSVVERDASAFKTQ